MLNSKVINEIQDFRRKPNEFIKNIKENENEKEDINAVTQKLSSCGNLNKRIRDLKYSKNLSELGSMISDIYKSKPVDRVNYAGYGIKQYIQFSKLYDFGLFITLIPKNKTSIIFEFMINPEDHRNIFIKFLMDDEIKYFGVANEKVNDIFYSSFQVIIFGKIDIKENQIESSKMLCVTESNRPLSSSVSMKSDCLLNEKKPFLFDSPTDSDRKTIVFDKTDQIDKYSQRDPIFRRKSPYDKNKEKSKLNNKIYDNSNYKTNVEKISDNKYKIIDKKVYDKNNYKSNDEKVYKKKENEISDKKRIHIEKEEDSSKINKKLKFNETPIKKINKENKDNNVIINSSKANKSFYKKDNKDDEEEEKNNYYKREVRNKILSKSGVDDSTLDTKNENVIKINKNLNPSLIKLKVDDKVNSNSKNKSAQKGKEYNISDKFREAKKDDKKVKIEAPNYKIKDKPLKLIDRLIQSGLEEKKKKDLKILKEKRDKLFNDLTIRVDKLKQKAKIPIFDLDSYVMLKKIGNGTYATVFEVSIIASKEKYALKKIIATNIEEAECYFNEFELIHNNPHDNIIKAYSANMKCLDSTTIAVFFLLELAQCDWDAEITRRQKLRKYYKEEELIDILFQLTDALCFLQNKKYSHRDVKPMNVLIFDNYKTYKLADFGEAKKVRIRKAISTLRGTEDFMSPILFNGAMANKEDITHDTFKSDVYSLGACFVYACCLDYDFLSKLRHTKNKTEMNTVLSIKFKNRYSDTFVSLLIEMMEYDEQKRMDFIQLKKYINKLFS